MLKNYSLALFRRLELKLKSEQKAEHIFVAPPYCQTACWLLFIDFGTLLFSFNKLTSLDHISILFYRGFLKAAENTCQFYLKKNE